MKQKNLMSVRLWNAVVSDKVDKIKGSVRAFGSTLTCEQTNGQLLAVNELVLLVIQATFN